MGLVLFIARFVGLYMLMVLAGFLACLAYHGNIYISTWSETGRNWMVFAPFFITVILFIMDMCDAFRDRVA